MNTDIRHFAKVGFAHFMLYPDCVRDEQISVRTLGAFVERDDLECVDCCLPFDERLRETLIPQLRECGRHLGYSIHPFPLDKISLGSLDDNEQGLIRMVLMDQIRVAAAIGARHFTIASGPDPGEQDRKAAQSRFANCCRWICAQAKKYDMVVLLEPFDRDGPRKFLYGPTCECVELIESLQPEVDNLKIQLDVAHVRLSGETFEHAILTAKDHLHHLHLGNCVMKDRSDPFFGDHHPPIGYPGSEIDTRELTTILRLLIDIGYLSKPHRGTLVIEVQPLRDTSVEQTMSNHLSCLHEAWKAA